MEIGDKVRVIHDGNPDDEDQYGIGAEGIITKYEPEFHDVWPWTVVITKGGHGLKLRDLKGRFVSSVECVYDDHELEVIQ